MAIRDSDLAATQGRSHPAPQRTPHLPRAVGVSAPVHLSLDPESTLLLMCIKTSLVLALWRDTAQESIINTHRARAY